MLPFIPAAVSVGSSLFGGGGGRSSGGGTSAGSSVPYYIPTGQRSEDAQLQALLKGEVANNPYQALNPAYTGYSNQLLNNPYAGRAQGATGTAGDLSALAGLDLSSLSGLLSGEAAGLAPGISSVVNMGLDPQSALYNQQLQKATDQANVTNAQYGLTGQAAAGSTDQALQNFNMQWQNQQLQRALEGLQGASTGGQAQAGLAQAAGQAGTGGTGLINAGGQLPYQQYTSNLNNLLSALSGQATFGAQANVTPSNAISQILSYLNYGANATNAGTGAANVNQNANQLAGQGIGSLFSGLSGLFSGSSPFGGAGNPLNLSSGSNFTPSDLSSISSDFAAGSGSNWFG